MAARNFLAVVLISLSLAGCPDLKQDRLKPTATATVTKKEEDNTISQLEKLAALDDATALLTLGDRYHRGDGVPRDDSKAFSLISQAAAKEHVEAESYVAFLHLTGQGTNQDTAAAKTHFSSAAKKGDCVALMFMAFLDRADNLSLRGNPKWLEVPSTPTCAPLLLAKVTALLEFKYMMYKNWAQAGRERAYWRKEYSAGKQLYRDVSEDLEATARLEVTGELQRRYDQFSEEYFVLHTFTTNDWPYVWLGAPSRDSLSRYAGTITDKNALNSYPETLPTVGPYHWAVAHAQFMLGEIFRYGLGLDEPRPVDARVWFAKAAASGHTGAAVELGDMHVQGHGGNQDFAEAARLFTQAAIDNYGEGQKRLGVLYLLGQGVQKNLVLAYAWLNLAASKEGHQPRDDQYERLLRGYYVEARPAWYLRKELAEHMTSQELSEGQRMSRGWKRGDNLAEKGAGSGSPDGTRAIAGYGSGFFVTQDGYFLTNHHVVSECKQITLRAAGETTARIVGADKINDIALLKASEGTHIPATFRSGDDLRQGEEVLVFGYPLSEILSSTGNLTAGVISAAFGVGNNTNQMQITAPVQSGASGAALMDKNARISGMVVSKLDAIRVAKFTGDIPQNVNFAIKGSLLRTFLATHGVSPKTAFFSFSKSGEAIAEEARKFTAVVACTAY